MNILISNDDGIKAEGIQILAKALARKGNVYVVAPDRQRSASSHALSISEKICVKETELAGCEKAFTTDGTPADCVKLGVDVLRRQGIEIDIVYSGINHGGNLGSDTMYSGTVSAAAEGIFMGLPAVAVSVDSHNPKNFEAAASLACKVLPYALKNADRRSVISINTPDSPVTQIKGVKAAKLGTVTYDQWFHVAEELPGETLYLYSGTVMDDPEWPSDVDVRLIREGFATISMVRYDLNDYEGTDKIKDWEITL